MKRAEVAIVSAVRTPIGRIRGALSPIRPDDMAGLVMAESLRRAGVEGDAVDEVFFGCANQAGEDNRNVARMGLLLAGLPQSVPGITVNRLCASGLSAVNLAARSILVGDANCIRKISFGLAELFGGCFQPGLGVLKILEDGAATALKDAAQEATEKFDQDGDDNRQVDQIGFEDVEVQIHHAASNRLMMVELS